MKQQPDQVAEAGIDIDVEALLRLRHVVADARRIHSRRTSALPGSIATRRRGRGTETDEVRTWLHGDDVRHIDRNSTARTGIPHVRTFRDEREQTTLLVADFRPSMLFGTRRAFRSVAAAEILALSGWRTVAGGGRVALIAVTGEEPIFVRRGAGDRAMTQMLGALRRAHASALSSRSDQTCLDMVLDMAARSLPRGGTIVLASGLDDPGGSFEDTVRRTLHRVDLRVAIVSDAFERKAPRGIYPFLGPDGVRGVRIITPPSASMSSMAWIEKLRRLGARAVAFEAEKPPERQLSALEELYGDA